jgi:hypothetical protein
MCAHAQFSRTAALLRISPEVGTGWRKIPVALVLPWLDYMAAGTAPVLQVKIQASGLRLHSSWPTIPEDIQSFQGSSMVRGLAVCFAGSACFLGSRTLAYVSTVGAVTKYLQSF